MAACHWRIASTGQTSISTLSVRLSRMIASVSSSKPIASATLPQAGNLLARQPAARDHDVQFAPAHHGGT